MTAPTLESSATKCVSKGGVRASLQTLFSVGTLAGLTDGQLLERFTRGPNETLEAAFTALVEQHGPMVMGVRRAVLCNQHDVDDACQATFLILVRRASFIRRRDTVRS
jgi:Sigma-70 region 2